MPSYTFAGPSSGPLNVASTNFTVTPSGTITSDTVSLSQLGGAGTFTPASLTWTNSSAAQTFTFTPTISGAITIQVVSSQFFTITPSFLVYTTNNDAVGTGNILLGQTVAVGAGAVSISSSGSITLGPLTAAGLAAMVNPRVVSETPAPNTKAATSTTVTATFNITMLSGSFTTSTFTLKHGPTSVSGTVAYDAGSKTVTFTPGSALTAGALYVANLTTGVTSSGGVTLASPFSWNFTILMNRKHLKWVRRRQVR